MAASAARAAALRLVGERRRRDGRMRDLLRSSSAMESLDARDRALASRLALGVVATRGALDAMIGSRLRRGMRLEPKVRDALQIAAYELCWLGTPAEVTVSQGVDLVRSVAPRAAGLANAVLRRIAAEDAPRVHDAVGRLRHAAGCARGAEDVSCTSVGERACGSLREELGPVIPDASDNLAVARPNTLEDAALAAGMPVWLLRELAASIGEDGVRDLALAQLDPAPVWVAANRVRMDAGEFADRAAELGLDVERAALPGSYAVRNAGGLAESGLVRSADAFPADLAAQMVTRIASPVAGERMLEVGQGRGTKTALLQLAAHESGGPARIVAIDSEAGKVRLAEKRLLTAGLAEGVRCLAFDGRALAEPLADGRVGNGFDLVFIDAPCSGTGTLRRHPEIVWGLDAASVDPANPDGLPVLQLALLRAAATRVRPGGTLVYATCSVLVAEDEQVIEAFLDSPEGQDFHIASVLDAPGVSRLDVAAQELISAHVTEDGTFRSAPRPVSPDGHFCTRLVRS